MIRAVNFTLFFDVYLISSNSNQVSHPVSSILGGNTDLYMEGDSSSLKHFIIIPDIGHSERKRRLYVIDEIGEMGLYSKTFATSVRALLQGGLHPPPRKTTIDPITVMATFPVSGQTHKLLKEVKSREDCVLFEVGCVKT